MSCQINIIITQSFPESLTVWQFGKLFPVLANDSSSSLLSPSSTLRKLINDNFTIIIHAGIKANHSLFLFYYECQSHLMFFFYFRYTYICCWFVPLSLPMDIFGKNYLVYISPGVLLAVIHKNQSALSFLLLH